MELDYCYHCHTERCGHAKGTDEQFVLSAIKNNIEVLGFSDHIFLKNIDLPGNRGSYNLLDEYIDSINNLKEKYKDQIELHIGFEAEYLPEYLDYYKDLLNNKKIEYLILGQHCKVKNNKLLFYGLYKNPRKGARLYTKDIIKGIKSGLFKYVCHPDYFTYWVDKNSKLFNKCLTKILKTAKKYDMPVEINLGGLRNPYLSEDKKYVTEQLFVLAKKYDVKVIIGIDAHDPIDFEISKIDYAKEQIKKYHLNEITRLDL